MVSAVQDRPCQEMDIIRNNVTLLIKIIKDIITELKSLVEFPLSYPSQPRTNFNFFLSLSCFPRLHLYFSNIH